MTLLAIIEDAARSLSVTPPATVIGNADLMAGLFLRFAQQEGEELSRRHDWQALTLERSFTSLNQVEQTGMIPADYDRLVFNAEIWDRTLNQKLSGPTPSRAWGQLKSGVSGGVTGWWRLLGGEIHVFPAPAAGNELTFEYVSRNFCKSAGGAAQARWEADSDVARIPERLITLGICWRWLRAKGMDYAEEMATYEREVEKACSRDRGTGVLRPPMHRDDPPQPFWNGRVDI